MNCMADLASGRTATMGCRTDMYKLAARYALCDPSWGVRTSVWFLVLICLIMDDVMEFPIKMKAVKNNGLHLKDTIKRIKE